MWVSGIHCAVVSSNTTGVIICPERAAGAMCVSYVCGIHGMCVVFMPCVCVMFVPCVCVCVCVCMYVQCV